MARWNVEVPLVGQAAVAGVEAATAEEAIDRAQAMVDEYLGALRLPDENLYAMTPVGVCLATLADAVAILELNATRALTTGQVLHAPLDQAEARRVVEKDL